MKKVVEREKNKGYYRVLHLPIWIWVFFILPGHLTYALYVHGPDRRHGLWLAVVIAFCIWRGSKGRLPGVEPKPYITHYGVDQPNLGYRYLCYTAAWIDILVPFALNFIGLVVAIFTGTWMLQQLYEWLYYPFAILVVLGTLLNLTPRARRSTFGEGAEKAWFYIGVWTVVPAQVAIWGAWRLGGKLGLAPMPLAWLRLTVFVLFAGGFLAAGLASRLPRTARYYSGAVVGGSV
jgi:hypothetical protein